MRPCWICLSPERKKVDGAIVANLGDAAIAEMFRTSKRSIKVHRKHLPAVLEAEAEAEAYGGTYSFTYAPTYNIVVPQPVDQEPNGRALAGDRVEDILPPPDKVGEVAKEGGGGIHEDV